MPRIRLPDGSIKEFDRPVTVADVAASIGPGLAKAALAGKIDGKLVDTSHLIENDASLAVVTDRDAEGVEVLRHSTAHLLAYAVKELFPEAQVTIGPVIEDGLYYDFSYRRLGLPVDGYHPHRVARVGHRGATGVAPPMLSSVTSKGDDVRMPRLFDRPKLEDTAQVHARRDRPEACAVS